VNALISFPYKATSADQSSAITQDNLSLAVFCAPCGSACCRYSSPILDKAECQRISRVVGVNCFEEITSSKGSYYVIGRKLDGSPRTITGRLNSRSEPCSFLSPQGHCTIQGFKPMDCAAYPVRALPDRDGRGEFYVDMSCPAHEYVSSEAHIDRKLLALMSMRRFSAECYYDWLHRFSPWTLDGSGKKIADETALY
jgi:Fe-S-cluster containining protein